MQCGCHCLNCGSTELSSKRTGDTENDGYYDMHHTCSKCNTHFDHLEGDILESCQKCGYRAS